MLTGAFCYERFYYKVEITVWVFTKVVVTTAVELATYESGHKESVDCIIQDNLWATGKSRTEMTEILMDLY